MASQSNDILQLSTNRQRYTDWLTHSLRHSHSEDDRTLLTEPTRGKDVAVCISLTLSHAARFLNIAVSQRSSS